jgi:6-phosphogluconolactonase
LSNFGLARRWLLPPLGLPDAHVHRIHGERRPVARAAAEYEAELRSYWGVEGSKDPPASTFDFVVLGVGPDGHTASLFPPLPTGRPSREWVAPVAPPTLPPAVERVTLTLRVINRSDEVAFLVCGSEKQGIVQRILRGRNRGDQRLPAARVGARSRLRWFLDAAAAGPAAVGGPSRVATG